MSFPLTKSTTIGVLSASQCVIFCIQRRENIEKNWAVAEWTTKFDLFDVDGIEWSGSLLGIRVARVMPCQRTSGIESMILVIPYFFLATLCLFLSLFLMRTGKLRPQTTSEPLPWVQIVIMFVIVAAVLGAISRPAVH